MILTTLRRLFYGQDTVGFEVFNLLPLSAGPRDF